MRHLTRLLIALAVTVPLLWAGVCEAKTPKRGSAAVRKERAEAQRQATKTRQQIEQVRRRTRSSLRDLDLVQAELEAKRIEAAALQRKVDAIDRSIGQVSDSIATLQANLAVMQKNAAESARQTRRMRQSMSARTLIFSSENFNQAIKRAGYLKQLDKSRAAKTRSLRAASDTLQAKKLRLDTLRQQQASTLAALQREQAGLQAKEQKAQALIADLKKNESALQKELNERQRLAAALEAELQRAIEEEARQAAIEEQKRLAEEKRRQEEEEKARLAAVQAEKERQALEAEKAKQQQQPEPPKQEKGKKKKDKKKDTPAPQPTPQTPPAKEPEITVVNDTKPTKNTNPQALTSAFASSKGSLPRPYNGPGQIVSKFGISQHSSLSKVQVDNAGVDIQASPGSSACAVHQGFVSSIFSLDGLHNIVMVRHGEYLTVYGGLVDLAVKKGDNVGAGQPLGRIYSDPDDDNRSILHFEVRREREKFNPEDWINF